MSTVPTIFVSKLSSHKQDISTSSKGTSSLALQIDLIYMVMSLHLRRAVGHGPLRGLPQLQTGKIRCNGILGSPVLRYSQFGTRSRNQTPIYQNPRPTSIQQLSSQLHRIAPWPRTLFHARYFSSTPGTNTNPPDNSSKKLHQASVENPSASQKTPLGTGDATPETSGSTPALRENIYTIPNFLTATRIASCPVLGWSIVTGQFHLASGLIVYAGLTDLADGYLARRFNMGTVFGSILDPAADKALMTTLVVSLAWNGMLPMPLAVLILGRDVGLSLSAFYYRYISLPAPKTFARYWDFSIPSAEVRPTTISKVNTLLQLLLMTATVFNPVLPLDLDASLEILQWVVAATTIWSGASYVWSKDAVRILSKQKGVPPSIKK